MRVTFINRLMGIAFGGGENFDLNMAQTIRKLGCEVKILAGGRPGGVNNHLDGLPVTYIATPYLRWLMYWGERVGTRPALAFGRRAMLLDSLLFELAAYCRIIRSNLKNTEVFQICALPRLASWLKKRLNKPAVVRWPGPPGPALQKWAGKYSANIASGDSLKQIGQGGIQVEDIPYGVDFKRFTPLAFADRKRHRNSLGYKDQHIVLLFVGRLLPIKKLPLLLQGFAEASRVNPNLRLLLVGAGIEKSMLINAVKDLGLSSLVTFAGPRFGESLVSMYGIADIFMIVSSYESFSSVTLEAMSCKLPVIASKVGYLQDLIEHGVNGLLFEDGNYHEMQNAILRLASDLDLRIQMGTNNRKKVVENYDWILSGRKLLKIYHNIVNKEALP